MDSRTADRPSYEETLRVIGRQLDAEPAYTLRVDEDPEGFGVQYKPTMDGDDMRTVHFTWSRLHDLAVFNTAGRGLARKRGRHSGVWEQFANGHQGFFRTLGRRLDREVARDLHVREDSDGIHVTYTREKDGLSATPVALVLHEPDILEMVSDAEQLRQEA